MCILQTEQKRNDSNSVARSAQEYRLTLKILRYCKIIIRERSKTMITNYEYMWDKGVLQRTAEFLL